ncbi:unnamed protein product [Chilo suppressalis]|uniref:PiggyBac transposable element-derived protein domain-containing protein n=1 Tax=Chilo suppressalis TaxID=168631 RepID=A0ABN8BFE8_CHISP|nr:unnamed protein product [Chilo suppressalis]
MQICANLCSNTFNGSQPYWTCYSNSDMDRNKIIALLLLLKGYRRKRRFWVHPFITLMNADRTILIEYYGLKTEEDFFIIILE